MQNKQSGLCSQQRQISLIAQTDLSLLRAQDNIGSQLPFMYIAKTQIRLGELSGWSESKLHLHVRQVV